jgi:hypothetical protein
MKFLVINIFFATLRLGVKIVIRDLVCSFAALGIKKASPSRS